MPKQLNFAISDEAYERYEAEKEERRMTWNQYFEAKSEEMVNNED